MKEIPKNQNSEEENKKYTLINILRILLTLIFIIVTFKINHLLFKILGISFFIFSIIWLFLTERNIIDENKNP
ncbi:MAG: hypothetical protein KDK36_19300, partial [Leptospiraceae bacterium]|nr:hypothetical protein [Leptospiraceae bacterium]